MTSNPIVVGDATFASIGEVIDMRREVEAELNALFVGFDPDRIDTLHACEPDIVRLFNSYQLLTEAVDRHTLIENRNNNIRAAWELLRELKKDSDA